MTCVTPAAPVKNYPAWAMLSRMSITLDETQHLSEEPTRELTLPTLPPEAHVSVVHFITQGLSGEDGAQAKRAPLRYDVERELGRGGMGKVLSAFDQDLHRRVAMKTLAEDGKGAGRFIEEAQVSAQLQHPNVLPVYDFGLDKDNRLYFTMKFVEGHETLRDVIGRLRAGDAETHRRFSFERRVQVIQQICQALSYAHQHGVSHRDVKPENVILGRHGEVYLADWGIAGLRDAGQVTRLQPEAAEPRSIVGTPAYMSPERFAADAPAFDPKSDVYALVAVLYEVMTLRHYIRKLSDARDPESLRRQIQDNPYVDAKLIADPVSGAVPPAISHLCRRGLSGNAGARFTSAAELEEALQRWLEGRAPVVCPRTAIQSGLCSYSRFVDRNRLAGPVVTAVIALGALAAVGHSLWVLLR